MRCLIASVTASFLKSSPSLAAFSAAPGNEKYNVHVSKVVSPEGDFGSSDILFSLPYVHFNQSVVL
jgi:hypothetical protein